ncbi:protein containing DUF132 [mine drainage metagenome]|uniref:Protein containing DUF132 n=1 Tax=mine drainage metagenome TaxID=410659 RepID=T0ZR20_9ZZZZ
MLRAVIDPGVLLSARLASAGTPAQLYARWVAGEFELVVCSHLLAELDSVLGRPKFGRYASLEEVDRYVAGLRAGVSTVPDPAPSPGLTRDPAGDHLVALARSAGVDYLVAGDADLTVLMDVVPLVCSPAPFLARSAS